MRVTVRLYATLQKYQPHAGSGEFSLELPKDAQVCLCVQMLGMPDKERYMAVVNGSQVPADRLLRGGDRVALFPPIAGGQVSS